MNGKVSRKFKTEYIIFDLFVKLMMYIFPFMNNKIKNMLKSRN